MKKLFFFSLVSLFFSCGSEQKDVSNTDNNTSTQDSLKLETGIPQWVIDIWKKHFNEKDVELLKALHEEWQTIKTEDELAAFYFKSVEQGEKIASNFSKKMDGLQEEAFYVALDAFINENDTTKPWLSGLDPTCFAECTSPGFRKNFALLYDKAKTTEGTNDDEYFKLMIETYGESGYVSTLYSNYFQGMWDYGGGSLLGSGLHAKILKKIDAIKKQTKIFDKEIKEIRTEILNDITKHIAYMNKTDKIVKEIEDILKSVKLNNDEKYELEIRKSEFLKTESEIQTDCENKNCDYGG